MKCPAEVSQVGELGLIHTSCCADQQPTSLSHSTQIHSPLRKSKATRFLALSVRKWRACSQLCGLVAQSCPTLCDPMDCSLPGSSVHGILQARRLEWVAISSSDFLTYFKFCIALSILSSWPTLLLLISFSTLCTVTCGTLLSKQISLNLAYTFNSRKPLLGLLGSNLQESVSLKTCISSCLPLLLVNTKHSIISLLETY